MHIALDVRFINSGTGTYAVKLLDHLQALDTENQYTILVPPKDKDYYTPTNPNFTVHTIPYKAYSLSEQIGYLRYLNELQPDLVHFCMPQQPILYRGKKITTVHDLTLLKTYNSDKNWLEYHIKQLVGRFVFRYIAKTNNHIITISNTTKYEYINHSKISDDKITTIYEAGEVSSGDIEPYPNLPYERFIMYVGQQPDYKNIRTLGDAHHLLRQKDPSLGLVLVGRMNEDTKRNKAYFENKGYEGIHFTGFIPDNQRDWLYQHALAYVFPSKMEGFGLPPLEAMAHGTPVISSNASCMPEILGDAAIYFNPDNIPEIADVIAATIANPGLLADMQTKGHVQAAKYSWARMAEETRKIYLDILRAA